MTTIDLGSFNIYLGIVINALATGFGMGCGIALGTYLSNNHILKLPKRIRKVLGIKKKRKKKNGGKKEKNERKK